MTEPTPEQIKHFPALVNELTDAAKTMEQVAKDLRSGFNHHVLLRRAERYRHLLAQVNK